MNKQADRDSKPAKQKPALVLVVDDEQAICWALDRILRDAGHRVVTASTAEEGLLLAAEQRPDLVLLDVRLPRQDGLSALPEFQQVTDGAPIVVMTAFGNLETAVAAVQQGAVDYLVKPFRLEDVARSCRHALKTFRPGSSDADPKTPPASADRLVGQSPAIQRAFRQIALVAASDLSVLITGETGTGKELVAAAIHQHSQRAGKPYIAVAPVAMSSDVIESELFGHVRGAFTGAITSRPGLFESADGGTVFLDEIGDLPHGTQVKLLRVLERGDFSRVGDVQARASNVRVLAATHRDLHRAVQDGSFREDLFYRLTGMQIDLPPLRERTEDLRALCEYFLSRLGYRNDEAALDDALLDLLARRPWYGNVRELRNAIEHAAVVARDRPLDISDFPPPQPGRSQGVPTTMSTLNEATTAWTRGQLDDAGDEASDLHNQFLRSCEPPLLRTVLEYTNGNRAQAAELLGIHRATLRERLRGYGLDETA